MARIIGSMSASHVPALGNAIARGLQQDPYWKPFFDGFTPAQKWLAEVKPDVAVVFSNDHGLNFFLDKMPIFAIGAAPSYPSADEGWGIPVNDPWPGIPPLSWHIANHVVEEEFDPVICQQMLIDHAVCLPMACFFEDTGRNKGYRPVKIVPVGINTVQFPMPSLKRCFEFGRAIGRAIESYPEDLKVVLIGTGGLSHQLEGERAGHLNKKFDTYCMDCIAGDPSPLLGLSNVDLIEQAGTAGLEFMNWMAMRGALLGEVREVTRTYHIPISNTAAAVQVLEQLPRLAAAAE
jgi:protocatechuate 4,5-dioxygenase beta chain